MGERAVVVADTNTLLNLATPVVDGRSRAPTGDDPLRALLTTYDVHVPSSVLGEVAEASNDDDLLGVAADLVLAGSHHLQTHDVSDESAGTLEYGLDRGESHGIWLSNELSADMFVTDEFNTTNYLSTARESRPSRERRVFRHQSEPRSEQGGRESRKLR